MSRAKIQERHASVFSQLSPFVVATHDAWEKLECAPFGVKTRWHIDPLDPKAGAFLRRLGQLDALSFGPEGMPMSREIFFECAEIPGAIYGLALPVEQLDEDERTLLRVGADETGSVPLSMYIAVPAWVDSGERAFFGHNLASLNRLLPARGLQGLGTLTKALALASFRAERFYGATQWASRALHVHTKFGALDLLSAWTPAHQYASTLTYHFRPTRRALEMALGVGGRGEAIMPSRWVAEDDVSSFKEIHRQLAEGIRWQVVGAPVMRGEKQWVPLHSEPVPP